MANDAAKKRLATNIALKKKHTNFILGFNVRRLFSFSATQRRPCLRPLFLSRARYRQSKNVRHHHLLTRASFFSPCVQAIYILYRIYFLWSTFSSWHIAGFSLTSTVYLVCYFLLFRLDGPQYEPLEKGGALKSGGADLSQSGGVIEYTWDMLFVTQFVQLTTCFLSDWFWLIYLIPPNIGLYFLWTRIIYPWISKPDAEPQQMEPEKMKKIKYGKAR